MNDPTGPVRAHAPENRGLGGQLDFERGGGVDILRPDPRERSADVAFRPRGDRGGFLAPSPSPSPPLPPPPPSAQPRPTDTRAAVAMDVAELSVALKNDRAGDSERRSDRDNLDEPAGASLRRYFLQGEDEEER